MSPAERWIDKLVDMTPPWARWAGVVLLLVVILLLVSAEAVGQGGRD